MGPLGGVWEMGEERASDGSSRRVESGRKRGKLPSNVGSLFSVSFQTFCLTARAYLNITQKYGLF